MPAGADTVFMQEDVTVKGDKVVLPAGLKPGVMAGAGGGSGVIDSALTPDRNNPPPDMSLTVPVKSYLPYYRHPNRNQDHAALRGGCMIGFPDGHADTKQAQKLFDPSSGYSTDEVLWSPKDRTIVE